MKNGFYSITFTQAWVTIPWLGKLELEFIHSRTSFLHEEGYDYEAKCISSATLTICIYTVLHYTTVVVLSFHLYEI